MLQAAIDESETQEGVLNGQLFVLAGYVSTIDGWASFTIAWEEALRKYTNGEPFSMAEASGRWKDSLNEIVGYLQSIIRDHAEFGIRVSCNPKMLLHYMEGVPNKRFKQPHYFCLWFLITHVLAQASDLIAGRKIDFIFDRGRTKQRDVVDHWDDLVMEAPEFVRSSINNDPLFRSSQEFLPLQAADMTAWWQRKRIEEHVENVQKKPRPTHGLAIPYRHWHISEDFLISWRKLNILGEPIPYHGPDGMGFLLPGGEKFIIRQVSENGQA